MKIYSHFLISAADVKVGIFVNFKSRFEAFYMRSPGGNFSDLLRNPVQKDYNGIDPAVKRVHKSVPNNFPILILIIF